MIKKYLVFICMIISVILIVISALAYPGGSLLDKNSVGFGWSKNFISNLFEAKAINGLKNPGRIWAILGMAFQSVGYGVFFINMSKKKDSLAVRPDPPSFTEIAEDIISAGDDDVIFVDDEGIYR